MKSLRSKPETRYRNSFRLAGPILAAALAGWLLAPLAPAAPALSEFQDFVRVRGDQLVEGGKPFRFISWNIPNLHLVEDNVAFTEQNPWRWPDRFEINDALQSVRQMGGTVVRTYVLSVVRTNDGPEIPRHVLGPGRFNEEGFRVIDEILQLANQAGVRVIIPFVDNWSWWGGRAEYAGFRGKPKDAFWTDPQIIADFEATVRHLVIRTNTLTGVPYREDKAVLCWETGNELESPPAWTREIAAFIKRLDANHPVMDGFHATELREESLAMPEVDIVTTHHYPGGGKSFAELVRANAAKAKGRKPYVVGEFGFAETPAMAACLDAVIDSGASGALAWSLRPHNRDGGYYWHSEPSGGNRYKAFHWPGSPAGAAYDEIQFVSLLREKAFAIRGLPLPDVPVPARPHLLPIADDAAISWQGSVGASSYVVERAFVRRGPWRVVGENVDESAVQYRPLFTDGQAGGGNWFYRVRARNAAGTSAPSNVVGPVTVTHRTLVDDFADLSQVWARSGKLELQTRDCRKAKEDAHRLAGEPGSTITYQLPSGVGRCRLDAFFPGEVADFRFSVSADGKNFTAVASTKQVYFQGAGDYGYWKPVRFETPPAGGGEYLKIEFAAEAQIGRLEIEYE